MVLHSKHVTCNYSKYTHNRSKYVNIQNIPNVKKIEKVTRGFIGEAGIFCHASKKGRVY